MTTQPETTRAPKPIILTRDEVRAVLSEPQAELRRALRPGPIALQSTYRPGDVLWVRESFATRREAQTIHVRYTADRGQGQARVLSIDRANRRFATVTYRTWPAKFMPRWASRLSLQVAAVRSEDHDGRRQVLLTLRLNLTPAPPASARAG